MRLGGITYIHNTTQMPRFVYFYRQRDDGPSVPKHVAFRKQNLFYDKV